MTSRDVEYFEFSLYFTEKKLVIRHDITRELSNESLSPCRLLKNFS